MKTKTLLLSILGCALLHDASAQSRNAPAETKYLTFQIQTGLYGYASQFHPLAGRHSLTKAQMEEFVDSVVKAVGATGGARHKLAFAIGPLCFDMPDEETRQFIHDAFAVARENDVAVALHIDDSMGWGERKDLISNPDNIETADWKQIPNTGRRMDWGIKPTKFAPQMCFNAPAIIAAVKERGALIGAEVKKEMDVLKSAGKEHLFAGLIAGWETRIGRDFETDRPLGYRALSHRGFSESNPPKDADHERVLVVKEFIELWADALHGPGVPSEKIYCHIAFTAQGLDHKEKTESVSTFALPEVAFSSGYRPGFSTYPSAAAFKEIWGHVAAHGSPAWISGEGTNVAPGTGMSSGITMETYLGRMFNHGAVMVNIFAWGMGGEAMRNHFFRRAAEDPEPLAAYGKFLRGEALNESDASGFSVEMLEAKMRRIQSELPAWMQKTGKQADATALMQKVQSLMKEKKWQEVDKAANEVLALMTGKSPAGAKVEAPSAIGSDSKTTQTRPSSAPSDDTVKRLTEKVERIKAVAREWGESGRDPSVIAKTMEEKFKPLMEAGEIAEAEAVVDRVLEQLKSDGKTSEFPTAPTQAAQGITDEIREKLAHNIGCSFLLFRPKVLAELKVTREQKEKLDYYLQKLLPEARQSMQKNNGERGKYNQKTHEEEAAVLKEILNDGQRTRLHQLELQKDGLFGPDWNLQDLQLTDAQRQQFMAPTLETQQKSQALMAEIRRGASPDVIRPKAFQLRLELEAKLETLLTEGQKQQWKAMLGRPVAPDIIYGGLLLRRCRRRAGHACSSRRKARFPFYWKRMTNGNASRAVRTA